MKRKSLILFLVVIMIITLLPMSQASAATKKYGIAIADRYGNYTFYDYNYSDKRSGVEITSSGNIMVPLWKLTKTMPSLKYNYNSKTKKATVTNVSSGKKIVFTKNSPYFYYYSSSKASGVKKKMAYKMYISPKSSSVMVHMASLRYVLASYYGVKSYKTGDMQKTGYDTSVYSGLIVYNPYKKVTGIPKATTVKGISKTVKVTIPEGYSVAQVFKLLASKGVVASTDYLYNAQSSYDFSYYSLVDAIPSNKNRCFLLEGYLYPDTYEFYRLSKGEDVIGKFLRNIDTKITKEDRLKAESLGYTVDEILTIASLIEKEAGNSELMPYISSVIHNRLDKGMKLQLDASIYYVERYIKPYIVGDKNRYNEYYNTYKCKALPAGPISNPGKSAIKAALNPANTNYLFFKSDEDGNYLFSVDHMEYVNPFETANNNVFSETEN